MSLVKFQTESGCLVDVAVTYMLPLNIIFTKYKMISLNWSKENFEDLKKDRRANRDEWTLNLS